MGLPFLKRSQILSAIRWCQYTALLSLVAVAVVAACGYAIIDREFEWIVISIAGVWAIPSLALIGLAQIMRSGHRWAAKAAIILAFAQTIIVTLNTVFALFNGDLMDVATGLVTGGAFTITIAKLRTANAGLGRENRFTSPTIDPVVAAMGVSVAAMAQESLPQQRDQSRRDPNELGWMVAIGIVAATIAFPCVMTYVNRDSLTHRRRAIAPGSRSMPDDARRNFYRP